MSTIKKTKAHIQSLSSIHTVKLQRMKNQAEQFSSFMKDFLQIAQVINQNTSIFTTTESVADGKDLIIVVGGDTGLSSSLDKMLLKEISGNYTAQKDTTDIFCIGKKTMDFFINEGFSVVGNQRIKDSFSEEDLFVLYTYVSVALQKKTYKSISLHFNCFTTKMQQLPLHVNLFPLEKNNVKTFFDVSGIDLDAFLTPTTDYTDLVVEPTAQSLVEEIQQQLIQHIIYGAIVHNKTGEITSRMLATKYTKSNTIPVVKSLKLLFSKAHTVDISTSVSAR